MSVELHTNLEAKVFFHYVLDKLLIKEIEPKFLQQIDIVEIFSVIKELYIINNTIPTPNIIYNELLRKNKEIKLNLINQIFLSKETEYVDYLTSFGEEFVKNKISDRYKDYLVDKDILERRNNQVEKKINSSEYLVNNNISNPFENKNNDKIRKDKYGKVDYSQFSDKELKDFNKALSKAPIMAFK